MSERLGRSGRDRRSEQQRARAVGARSRQGQGEVLGAIGSWRNCENECRVSHHRVGATRADVKVAGTAMLEVGVGNLTVRRCTALGHRVRGVTVGGKMQDAFYGFTSATAQHDSCDSKQDDEKPLRH